MTIILTFIVAAAVWVGAMFGADSKGGRCPDNHYGYQCRKEAPQAAPDDRKPF